LFQVVNARAASANSLNENSSRKFGVGGGVDGGNGVGALHKSWRDVYKKIENRRQGAGSPMRQKWNNIAKHSALEKGQRGRRQQQWK